MWWSCSFSCNILFKLGATISWNIFVSLCIWATKRPFTSSCTKTGMRWTCSNSSRTIQLPMRRRAPPASRSTIQSLLRGRRKVIKFLQQQAESSHSNQISSIYFRLWKKTKQITIQISISYPSSCFHKRNMEFALLLRLCKMLSPPKQEIVARLLLVSKLLLKQANVFWKLLKSPCLTNTEKQFTCQGSRGGGGKAFLCAGTLTPWAKTPHLFLLWVPSCLPKQQKTCAENRW